MGYRQLEKKKPIRRVLQDITTRNSTYVQNGATANIAIPCWYQLVEPPQRVRHHHLSDWEDHIGWPDPKHPDKSCQDAHMDDLRPINRYDYNEKGWHRHRHYLDMQNFFPIHLEDEGYTSVDVAFTNPPDGLIGNGYIDDYIVRFTLEPMCESAVEKDVRVPYTVFVNGIIGSRKARDVVAKGMLHILAGPIS